MAPKSRADCLSKNVSVNSEQFTQELRSTEYAVQTKIPSSNIDGQATYIVSHKVLFY